MPRLRNAVRKLKRGVRSESAAQSVDRLTGSIIVESTERHDAVELGDGAGIEGLVRAGHARTHSLSQRQEAGAFQPADSVVSSGD
ncbi:MAG: hypothetical protein H6742_15205 [Alphaproteobacteria bacterium]|nr:hypothetical protein [Alphaproteobacteria bacterium]